MKKIILLCTGLLFIGTAYTQVIFSGVSPASIEGGYDMEYGETAGGWGGPDLADTTIQDTLVKYLTDIEACSAATNGADINKHIAILYRGVCDFAVKVQNAQTAGAIAVVVINNKPGSPVGMAPGTVGASTTIPVVMVSDVDGAALLAEMGNGPVVVFMGNKNGYFADDMGTGKGYILRPQYSSIPSVLATDGTEYPINVGTRVFNYGSNDQTNIVLKASIVFEGDTIYNESSALIDILAGDSMDLTLPNYEPTEWKEGYYRMNYTLKSDAPEEYDYDNSFESNFVISPSEFAYASMDSATSLPNVSSYSRALNPTSSEPTDDYSSCIAFQNPNASKLAPKSISFAALKGSDALDSTMTGESVLISVYEYNDNFTINTDNGFKNPIELKNEVMTKEYIYPSDLSDTMVTVSFDNEDIMAMSDDQRYLFCVTSYNKFVYLGIDGARDYTKNYDFYKQPMVPVGESGTFNPNGFGPTTIPAISVAFIDANMVSLKKEAMSIVMDAYPSPASDMLNVEFNDNNVSKVELVNMMGQTVETQDVKANAEKATLNVSGVENGVYIVKVHLTNNLTHTIRVVVSH